MTQESIKRTVASTALILVVVPGIYFPARRGGSPGWYGEVHPYESRMTFAMVADDLAGRLMEAVATGAGGLEDLEHPVRAVQLAAEQASACGESSGEGP